eukprot:5108814-Ditylum_brightwellii.AAC.1
MDIQNNIENIAQTWENLIFGPGYKLSLKKTYWWMIWWVWNGGKATMATKVKLLVDIVIIVGRSPT